MRAAAPSHSALNERQQITQAAQRQPAQSPAAPAFADRRAQAVVLRKTQDAMNGSPRTTQLMALQAMMGNGRQPLQLRAALNMASAALGAGQAVAQLSAVKEDKGNDTDALTSDKRIDTKNLGEAWFRFKRTGGVIDSFAENKTTEDPAGVSPVNHSIDLADSDKFEDKNIAELSRQQHFSAGDKLAGITANDRKSSRTWHHKQDEFEMELVDMAVHRSFGHKGGFSKWKEDSEEAD